MPALPGQRQPDSAFAAHRQRHSGAPALRFILMVVLLQMSVKFQNVPDVAAKMTANAVVCSRIVQSIET